MKKYLLTLACVFGMSTAAFALTSSAVLLQHNGNITTYAPEDIGQVMADAANGDEVFLNEGVYPGFTISKAIKIKGAGQLTVIDGDITIDNGSDTSIGDIFIGFVKVNGVLSGKSKINILTLLQCNFNTSFYSVWNAIVDKIFVDRCDIHINLSSNYTQKVTVEENTTTYTYPYVKEFTAINSDINCVQSTSFTPYPHYTFINCNFSTSSSANRGLTIINSMITGAGYLSFSDVTNSSYHKNSNLGDSNKATGCYIVTDSNLLPTSSWTVEQLEENGYYGNDGTVIGPLGGSRGTPYTLVPVVPRVTESSLSVNPQEKKLNVSVTVTPK